MKRKTFVLIIAVLGMFSGGFAEVRTFTLSNAVDTALKNNRQILQAEAELKAAQAQAGQSFADLWYPHVDIGAGFQYIDQQSVTNSHMNSIKVISNQTVMTYTLPVLVSNQITNAFQDNYSLTASVAKTLFAGMRYWNAHLAKNVLTDIARLKLENKKKEIAADVSVSFYKLLLLRENVRLNETLAGDVKSRIDDNRAKFSQGMLSEFEEIRSEVQYENLQPVLERLRNAYSAQKIALFVTLGLTVPDEAEFIGQFSDATNGIFPLSPDKAVAMALSNSLDLMAMDKTQEALRLNRNIADGGKYPAMNAYFNYKYDYKKQNVNDELRSWGGGWNAGLQLNIPVEEWIPGSRTDQLVKEADANLEKMEAARAELSEGLSARIRTLLIQYNEAGSLTAKLYGISLKARKAYELAKKLYLNGASTALALNDAQINLTQVQSAYLQEMFNCAERWIYLKRLTEK